MFNNPDKLKKMLVDIEELKVGIMEEINKLNANERAVFPTTVYPLAKIQPMIIEGFPVFQFSYEGMLPHFKEDDRKYLAKIRYYYLKATFDSYDYDKITYQFEDAVLITVQYFKDNIRRDLDNRSKKYIQDAIKQSLLGMDDNWKNVWNLDMGYLDKGKNHVQVYVVERKNLAVFYDYLLENHYELIKENDDSLSKENIFMQYQEELLIKEQEEKERKKLERKLSFKPDGFFN